MSMDNRQQGLAPGAMLRHQTYRIERVLGQGGFGITYLATDLSLDRLVAIKEFFPKDFCDRDASTDHITLGTQSSKAFVERLKAKFLKEARNIARLDHPGIIRIHAAFEENGTAYYVMDYIEGESLSEIVKRRGPLPEAKALEYIRKVGSALEYVHSKHINHLDIKPANIMVRRSDDCPILIDFGLSKQYDSEGHQTSTTPTGISHGYAPMEQYNDGGVKEFSPQTDIYSLAATLYYLLSGITPPHATKLIEEDLTFPAAIPPRLIAPIAKAMAIRKTKRHGGVHEFICDLDGIESDDAETMVVENPKKPEPTKAYTHAPVQRKTKSMSTGLKVLLCILSVICIVGFYGGIGWLLYMSASDAEDESMEYAIADDESTIEPIDTADMVWIEEVVPVNDDYEILDTIVYDELTPIVAE